MSDDPGAVLAASRTVVATCKARVSRRDATALAIANAQSQINAAYRALDKARTAYRAKYGDDPVLAQAVIEDAEARAQEAQAPAPPPS